VVKLNLHLLYFGPRNASYTNSTSIFLLFITIVLSWPEDGRSRPKHVAKYNLIVIIASCLDVCCVLMVHNMLYKFDIHNGMASVKKENNFFLPLRFHE